MEKLKALIVEDEMIIANDMRMTLDRLGYEVLGIAKSEDIALQYLRNDLPDIVLLDINLGNGGDGISLAKALREEFNLPFLFCTSYADEATINKAKVYKPNGYLLKPFTNDDLYAAIEIAFSNFTETDSANEDVGEPMIKDGVFVKDGKFLVKLKFEDIVYASHDKNYVEIYTLNRKYPVRSSLKDFLEKLPSEKFYQIHRSYVVNISHISAINTNIIKLADYKIPISKKYKEDLLSKIVWLR